MTTTDRRKLETFPPAKKGPDHYVRPLLIRYVRVNDRYVYYGYTKQGFYLFQHVQLKQRSQRQF
jgi:hypothetical protein